MRFPDENEIFDVLVIGGGPAALSEVLHLSKRNLLSAVISDAFGGSLSMMGDILLQSYIGELSIQDAPCELEEFVSSRLEARPTGREYANFIRACFDRLDLPKIHGRVDYISKPDGVFVVDYSESGHKRRLRAKNVILSTGAQPKLTNINRKIPATLTCFETYRKLADGDFDFFRDKEVCVIGSGNSAFQLAYSLARTSRQITLLVNRYVGFYPMENPDRFGLRAPSLRAVELIEKTSDPGGTMGALNDGLQRTAPIQMFAYSCFGLEDSGRTFHATIPADLNSAGILRRSLRAAVQNRSLRSFGAGEYRWQCDPANTIFISAVGLNPSGVASAFPLPVSQADSSLNNREGRTAVEGLFVAGAAAGFSSVNLMRAVSQHEPFRNSFQDKLAI